MSQTQHADLITVAVVSDTHAHLDARIAALIKDCDYALHAGDVCGVNVLNAMQPKSGEVYAVAGNNDIYCHDSETPLPDQLTLDIAGGRIAIEHGHRFGGMPSHTALREAHPDAHVIVYGHSHHQTVDQTATPWVINPGAAGKERTNGGPSCLVLECVPNTAWQVKTYRFT